MSANNLTITAYTGYNSTTAHGYYTLRNATGLRYSTQYPGGLCTTASFFVPYDIMEEWPVSVGNRIDISNGLDKLTWQGVLTTLETAMQGGQTGYLCTCTGYWGYILMRRTLHKPWADSRIDDNAWPWDTTATAAEKCTIDRNNRIRFTPKNVSWTGAEYAQVVYTAPTGQTIKRIKFDYVLQEAAQQWTLNLWNISGAYGTVIASTSGTSSYDGTLSTPTTVLNMYLQAGATQTPTSDGTYYGEVSNIIVFTETGTITGQTIATYIGTTIPELSTDLSQIGTLSYDLGNHFVADPPMTYADILTEATKYGDASWNSWGAYVELSNPGGDNKPRLALQMYPALTSADYLLSMDGRALSDSLRMSQTLDNVTNYVNIQYNNAAGKETYLTPTGDSRLVDAAGTAAYGKLEPGGVISPGVAGTAAATNYGIQYLTANKAVKWRVSGALSVTGAIRGSAGQSIPASEIRAGKRLRIENFLEDLSGSGLTFIITGTDYDDNAETCSISVGLSDALPVWLARQIRSEGKY